MIWNILVYAIVAVGVILLVALTVYRIDWARHPEKYKELEKSDEKSEYWAKKKRDQEAAQKRAKDREKAKKQQKRLDKVNHYRAIAGQKPLDPSQLNKKAKK